MYSIAYSYYISIAGRPTNVYVQLFVSRIDTINEVSMVND
jgi:hypothetical protein